MSGYSARSMGSATGTTSVSSRRYHHGDLPNALREAARDVIVERGLGDFSLREVARRAGVSHTAPAHHFGDVEGLLTSIATEGFTNMSAAMNAALDGVTDPVERLVVMGETYVEFASTHRADCDVMFRTDVVDQDDGELAEAGLGAYAILEDTVRRLLDTEGIDADVDTVAALCWSMVQGIVVLGPKLDMSCELKGRALLERPVLVRQFTDFLVNGLRSHRA